jgi:hypothetical protein
LSPALFPSAPALSPTPTQASNDDISIVELFATVGGSIHISGLEPGVVIKLEVSINNAAWGQAIAGVIAVIASSVRNVRVNQTSEVGRRSLQADSTGMFVECTRLLWRKKASWRLCAVAWTVSPAVAPRASPSLSPALKRSRSVRVPW